MLIQEKIIKMEAEKKAFKSRILEIEDEKGVRVLLAYVRGSHMYGINTPTSDVDITFVYQQLTRDILRGDYKEQMNIDKDTVGYEIERFLNLLSQNNPNVLEALDIPEDCLIFKAPEMDRVLDPTKWLSKLTEKTILGYANSQVKKATGLNKKMNNPMVEKKDILDFCYIISGHESLPIKEWEKNFTTLLGIKNVLKTSGLVKIPNGRGLYGLYIDNEGGAHNFRGLIKDSESSQLRLSSIPKDYPVVPYTMFYNQDAFEIWKKDYESYQKWLVERNEERFKQNQEVGKSVDLKNMTHLFRLLSMAMKISQGEGLKVREDDVEWLMEIRRGEVSYDELVESSEIMFEVIRNNFETLEIQEAPDQEMKKNLILSFRV